MGRGFPLISKTDWPSSGHGRYDQTARWWEIWGGGYKVSGGLHGIGVSAVNAVSEWMETKVKRDGKLYRQRFERGAPVTDVEVIGTVNKKETGTIQTFMRDETIFQVLEYEYDALVTRFREMAFLTRGITLQFIDERPDEPREMNFISKAASSLCPLYEPQPQRPSQRTDLRRSND